MAVGGWQTRTDCGLRLRQQPATGRRRGRPDGDGDACFVFADPGGCGLSPFLGVFGARPGAGDDRARQCACGWPEDRTFRTGHLDRRHRDWHLRHHHHDDEGLGARYFRSAFRCEDRQDRIPRGHDHDRREALPRHPGVAQGQHGRRIPLRFIYGHKDEPVGRRRRRVRHLERDDCIRSARRRRGGRQHRHLRRRLTRNVSTEQSSGFWPGRTAHSGRRWQCPDRDLVRQRPRVFALNGVERSLGGGSRVAVSGETLADGDPSPRLLTDAALPGGAATSPCASPPGPALPRRGIRRTSRARDGVLGPCTRENTGSYR